MAGTLLEQTRGKEQLSIPVKRKDWVGLWEGSPQCWLCEGGGLTAVPTRSSQGHMGTDLQLTLGTVQYSTTSLGV